ncbi:MAG TPA: alpha/beta fold hydrolase [Geminicoccaceae bacterium]|nr:alpha/beta fold hydrolase [Geminicoccaceae bacterium]
MMATYCPRLTAGFALALLAAVPSSPGWGQGTTVKQDLFLQSSTDPNIKLHIRERLPAGADPREIRDAVLFVHGATFGGDTFDLELPGYDWMTQIAQRGFAAYYVDLRGYGHSTRPPTMSELPAKNEPFARAEEVVADLGDTVDFIRERTGADKINLIGWSWGATITGMYTAAHNDKVDRLVLYAPLYSNEEPKWVAQMAAPGNLDEMKDVGAYRAVDAEMIAGIWEDQIVPADKAAWREEKVFDVWFDTLLTAEPTGADAVRAPNGVLVDEWEMRHARPVYDAGQIKVPTLVIRGDADRESVQEDALGVFEKLGSDEKLYVTIGDATHFVSLEKRAPELIRQVQSFLER